MSQQHIAQCMGCVDGGGVEDNIAHQAPFFCVSFPLEDSTSVPERAKRLLYALHRTSQCTESGVVANAFMHGEYKSPSGSLHCGPSPHKGCAALITRALDFDGATQSVPAMRMQLRVYRASVANATPMYYMWVTVHSPLPFSLRHAVCETLHRMRNEEWVPEVKRIWNVTATNVKYAYTEMATANEEQMLDAWGQSTAWLTDRNPNSFTALFSAKRAHEVMVQHFMHHNQGRAPDQIRGFQDPFAQRDAAFLQSCVHFDQHVDHRVHKGNKKKRKRQPQQNEEVEEEEVEEEEVEEVEEVLDPPVGCEWEQKTGLPPCEHAIEVHVALSENARGFAAFDSLVRTLPQRVQNAIVNDLVGLSDEMEEEEEQESHTLEQSRCSMTGGFNTLQQIKTAYAAGDKHWHRHHMHSILRADPTRRFQAHRSMMKGALQMAFSRAAGSDGYTNARVAAYLRFARRDVSAQKCAAMAPVSVSGCNTTAALHAFGETLTQCNRLGFYLRPDNLHLLQLLMVSDIMQCLNFHNQAIRCAPNGIGATIFIRNGGGHYRRVDHDKKPLEVCSKSNGSGADITMGVLVSMLGDMAIFDANSESFKVFEEIRKSSEHGLLEKTCVRIEGVAGPFAFVIYANTCNVKLL